MLWVFKLALVAGLVITLAACGGEPTPTPAPTRRPTRTPVPAATLKPKPTREIPTLPPLPTETMPPSPTATEPAPTAAPQGSGAGARPQVWTMAPLVKYFSNGEPAADEPIARPENVNPLTGLVVGDPALLKRQPVMARLGNDPNARSIHAGFNQADLVFEEMIDQKNMVFAITRFTLIYLGQNASFRPLRSARAVNASLMPMFDGILVSSGGSDGTRFMISQLPWKDLNLDGDLNNQIICLVGSDWRTRVASSVERVQEYIASKGLAKPVTLRGFQFADAPPGGTPASSIAFDHGPWPYKAAGIIEWRYDGGSGKYLRFVSGSPHMTQQYRLNGGWGRGCEQDEPQSEQIAASNVVVLNARYEPTDFVEDTLNSYSAFVELTGSGDAIVFRDGVRIPARWERPTLESFIKLVDASGTEIALKPGNTWFEIAPLGYVPTVR